MDPLLEPVRVMSVEDWAEIRRLHRAERMSIKAIVRKLGISRDAVRRALAASGPPRYERPARGSRVDAVEPQIRALLQATPTMPATVIAERIGWEHGLTVLKERVAVLRPFYLPPDPASRTTYDPGDRVQCDLWEPPVDIPQSRTDRPVHSMPASISAPSSFAPARETKRDSTDARTSSTSSWSINCEARKTTRPLPASLIRTA